MQTSSVVIIELYFVGMGVGAGPPGGMTIPGYPASNGLSSGLAGIPPGPSMAVPRGSSLGGIPPSSYSGGIPPSSRSPGVSMPGPSLPMGMSRMQPGVPNGLGMQPTMNGLPPSVSPHGGLAPSGPSPGIPAAQIQAYPHLAGAAGFSTSQPASIYGASGLGSSPYSTPQPITSYPSTMSMNLNGGTMQSPYSGLSNPPSSIASASMAPYPTHGGLTSVMPSAMPSAMSSGVAPSVYGMSSLRGPTTGAPGPYPSMTTPGAYPCQPPSNPGMLRTSPIVPTPAYPTNPYGRPL